MRTGSAGGHRRRLGLAGATAVPVLLLTASTCGWLSGSSTLQELVPRSTNNMLYAKPATVAADADAARAIGWARIVEEVRAVGIDVPAMDSIILAELESFGKGRGTLVAGRTSSSSAALDPSLSSGDPPVFTEEGLEFRSALRPGWYWTEREGYWLAACDRTGCTLAAATLSGKEPSLFVDPPEEAMRSVFEQMSSKESFHMLWIPVAATRDKLEAASVLTGFAVSAYFRTLLPAEILNRFGSVRGMAAEGHGASGQLEITLRIAMNSPGAAQLISGSYGLLQGLAQGLESFAKSIGTQPPPMPAQPAIAVTSEEHVVVMQMLTVP